MNAKKSLEVELCDLLYVAVDQGTPRNLRSEPRFDTLEKIADKTLAQLDLADQGINNMLQTLNAHLPDYGSEKNPGLRAKKTTTPRELWKAIWKALGQDVAPAIPSEQP